MMDGLERTRLAIDAISNAIEQRLNRLFEEGRPIPALERLDLCDQILALPNHERIATITKKFMYLNVNLEYDPIRWSAF